MILPLINIIKDENMIAFHGDETIKVELLEELKRHKELDLIEQGQYGNGPPTDDSGIFRGCAVGCSIRSLHRMKVKKGERERGLIQYDNRDWYAKQIGVPVYLIMAEECIFETFRWHEKEYMLNFPSRFIESLNVGVDYSEVYKDIILDLCEGCVSSDILRAVREDDTEFLKGLTVCSNSSQVRRTVIKLCTDVHKGWLGYLCGDLHREFSGSYTSWVDRFLSVLSNYKVEKGNSQ